MKRSQLLRPTQISPTGLKRSVLQQAVQTEHAPLAKPVRVPTKINAHILVICHSDNGTLDDHARQTIAAAAILADANTAVVALILGELHEDLSETGADEVMVLESLNFQLFQPDIELAVLLNVIKSIQPKRIFMPDNLIGDGDLGRRLIAHTQLSAATQVVEIGAKHVASYQANRSQLANIALSEIVLLAANVIEAELPFTSAAMRTQAPLLNKPSGAYIDQGLQATVAGNLGLDEADFIVSAGNGVQNLATLEHLASALGASVGASRVVVDAGKIPRDKQVGSSGKSVVASAYIAVGISGAVQHLQGIKDCRNVIAINLDSSAPIIKRADLSIIGDAEEIMQALITEIANAKKAMQ
jgi:electron transfer flavoprotein alpha subunit